MLASKILISYTEGMCGGKFTTKLEDGRVSVTPSWNTETAIESTHLAPRLTGLYLEHVFGGSPKKKNAKSRWRV